MFLNTPKQLYYFYKYESIGQPIFLGITAWEYVFNNFPIWIVFLFLFNSVWCIYFFRVFKRMLKEYQELDEGASYTEIYNKYYASNVARNERFKQLMCRFWRFTK